MKSAWTQHLTHFATNHKIDWKYKAPNRSEVTQTFVLGNTVFTKEEQPHFPRLHLQKHADNMTNEEIMRAIVAHLLDLVNGLREKVDACLDAGDRPQALRSMKTLTADIAGLGCGAAFATVREMYGTKGDSVIRTGSIEFRRLSDCHPKRLSYNDALKIYEGTFRPHPEDQQFPRKSTIAGLTLEQADAVLAFASDFEKGVHSFRPIKAFLNQRKHCSILIMTCLDLKEGIERLFVLGVTGSWYITCHPVGANRRDVWVYHQTTLEKEVDDVSVEPLNQKEDRRTVDPFSNRSLYINPAKVRLYLVSQSLHHVRGQPSLQLPLRYAVG